MSQTNQFFKILRCSDDGIVDIVMASSREEAHLNATKEWPISLRVAEATRSEWLCWEFIDWERAESFGRDMVSADGF